ncbi:MAG: hypothetical protein N3G19_02830, partial [Candidatus Pacearchaeota archaeon]|nr:hypothetical protein [Candidatus Pacearchaeota archaeon]
MKRRIKTEAMIETIFMIILVLTMPAVMSALEPEVDLISGEIKQNPIIDSFASIFSKFIAFFDIVPSVSAQELPTMGCCEIMKNGAKCQLSTLEECQSPQQWHEDQTCDTICQIGCCISSDGMCNKQTISTQCLIPPALKFIANDPQCQQDILCKMGCCTVGYQKLWTTNLTCADIYHGVWDGNVPDELTCIQQAAQEQRGCCKSYAGCEYITAAECQNKGGTFFTNLKCYQNVPGCNCPLTSVGKCAEGFPDLYKVDSCGNVYVDEVLESCGNGFCNPSSNKCESGKCTNVYDNYKTNGDFTNLPGRHNQERESGESWCVYDRPDLTAGNGTEPAGSRHWRRYCLYGKEYSEPCADYRQQICSENLFDISIGKITTTPYYERYLSNNYRSIASCVGNPWRVCLTTYKENECNKNPGCFWVSSYANDVGKLEAFKSWFGFKQESLVEATLPSGETAYRPPNCLPKIPPGFDGENKNAMCSFGSYACIVLDRINGDTNPECDYREWWELMALRCQAIGDCGAKGNYLHPDQFTYGDPFTGGSVLIAEIDNKTDDQGNVIGKKIIRLIDLVKDTNYEEILKNQQLKTISAGGRRWLGDIGIVLLSAAGIVGIALGTGTIALYALGRIFGVLGPFEWLTNILPFDIISAGFK